MATHETRRPPPAASSLRRLAGGWGVDLWGLSLRHLLGTLLLKLALWLLEPYWIAYEDIDWDGIMDA